MQNIHTFLIRVEGLVQGVGFRPFIYRLAQSMSLKGTVENANEGVFIYLNAQPETLETFLQRLQTEAPPASRITQISVQEVAHRVFKNFEIIKSSDHSNEITEVSPDIAVCDDCLMDMHSQPHRTAYPFVNCTNCGPRFTIIMDLPYDRCNTTMDVFQMCDICRSEYENIEDRRFHAQPVACNTCGPHYTLHVREFLTENFAEILDKLKIIIEEGGVVAIKGLGGYFLCCDALNEQAVRKIREIKKRDQKPFAVMFRDIDTLQKYAFISANEEKLLLSWQRPIVILKYKKPLAYSVSLQLPTVGAMLPYMPFHYLLFEHLKTEALVMTSGNISEEPIIIDDSRAINTFGQTCDAVLTYNREIYNRVDDSVMYVSGNMPIFIRRSRGFVPSPIMLNVRTEGILATGAELNNTFCIGKGFRAIISQHIGDLHNLPTMEFFEQTLERFYRLFRFQPNIVACDAHPDYFSSKFARQLHIPRLEIQHHHAHIASCMAEYGLDGKVIGVAFDGTGYGTDHTIWGSEFFVCDYTSFERILHFQYIPLPGGDRVTDEPWRTALALLFQIYGEKSLSFDLPFMNTVDENRKQIVFQMLRQNLNCPLSCGAGRYFDAVSALLNVCTVSKYHAQAPALLESLTIDNEKSAYEFDIVQNEVHFTKTIDQIINDIRKGVDIREIATRFHNTIVDVVVAGVYRIREQTSLDKVVLSGGVFQNRYLLSRLLQELSHQGFQVFIPTGVPPNDAGISLGQLAIAAHLHLQVEK